MKSSKAVCRLGGTIRPLLVLGALFLSLAFARPLSADEKILKMVAPHIHAYSEATISFRVLEPADGSGIKGLSPIIRMQKLGEDTYSEITLKSGELTDKGDGEYTWTRTFPGVGVYSIYFTVTVDGHISSRAFPLQLTQAGGERIFMPSREEAVYNYQIRWSADPGVPRLGQKATFDIELKRTIGAVNVEEPWNSKFEHLQPANLKKGSLQVLLESADGMQVADLTSTLEYRGLGIYRVNGEIPAAGESPGGMSGHGSGTMSANAAKDAQAYRLHVRFTDDAGYPVDETGEEYDFVARKPGSIGSQGAGQAAAAQKEQQVNNYKVELAVGGGQARTGGNEVIVRIRDAANAPVEDATVKLTAAMDDSAAMDSHGMKDNKPINLDLRMAQGAKGEYRGRINLPYAGAWLVGVSFSAMAGMEEKAEYRIEVASGGPNWTVIGGFLGVIFLVILIAGIRKAFATRAKMATSPQT